MQQQTVAGQHVVGDEQHEHAHPAVVHTHDHYHVSHHHTGGVFGEFEHRSHYHEHEHNHGAIVHAHRERDEDSERRDHESTAHTHDHEFPTGGGHWKEVADMPDLDTKQRNRLRGSQFAYVDKDGEGHLPLNDASHVRNAMARFNQTEFESEAAKERARRKIVTAAKKHDIEISPDDKVAKRTTSLRAASTRRGPRGGRKKDWPKGLTD
jgi:hypothetical protein